VRAVWENPSRMIHAMEALSRKGRVCLLRARQDVLPESPKCGSGVSTKMSFRNSAEADLLASPMKPSAQVFAAGRRTEVLRPEVSIHFADGAPPGDGGSGMRRAQPDSPAPLWHGAKFRDVSWGSRSR